MSIDFKDFSINRAVNPQIMQVHLHNELKLNEELKIVFDNVIKEPIEPAHP